VKSKFGYCKSTSLAVGVLQLIPAREIGKAHLLILFGTGPSADGGQPTARMSSSTRCVDDPVSLERRSVCESDTGYVRNTSS
jgi:hypothetical protein